MAAALTEGMLRSMFLFRLKVAAVVVLMTGFGSTAMGVFPGLGQGGQPPPAPGQAAMPDPQPRPGPTQAPNFPEGPISKIEFEGNATITTDKLEPKLLSRVGQPLDQDRVDADLKTLMATKWFSDVRYELDESPPKSGKFALIFVVREMPLLTKVEFRGRKVIRLKEIEDMTGLKAGKRADPMQARLAISRIPRLYADKGYDLASVTLLEGGNSGDSEIVIEIFEGPKQRIRSINFTGNHFATDDALMSKISREQPTLSHVGGAQHRADLIEERQNPINYDVIDDAKQRMIKYYKDEGFLNVVVSSILREGDQPGDLHLVYAIEEGPRWPNSRPPHPNPLPKKGRGR